jgi:hypothetical protein
MKLHMLYRTGLVVAALTAATSCSKSPTADVPSISSSAQPTERANSAEGVLASAFGTYTKLVAVEGRLVEKCMDRKGFGFHPKTEMHASPALDLTLVSNVPVSTDPADPFRNLSADYRRRYAEAKWGQSGSEAGRPDEDGREAAKGCVGGVFLSLYQEPYSHAVSPYPIIYAAVMDGFAADQRLRATQAKWSSCMQKSALPKFADSQAARGYALYYHYPVGDKPGVPVPTGGPLPFVQAREKEIKIAVADAECADRTGLRDVQTQVWGGHLSKAVRDNEVAIFASRDEQNGLLAKAQKLLAGA